MLQKSYSTNDKYRIIYVRFKSTKGAIVSNGKDTIILIDKSVKNTPEEKIIIDNLSQKLEAWRSG